MKIRKATKKDFKNIMAVVKKLHPKWFDNFATSTSIPFDLKIHSGFVAEDKGKIIGFLTFTSDEGKARISWMGVKPKFHGKSTGTSLLKALEKELKNIGLKELRVETLSELTEYEPYEKTRLFYKKMGFKVESTKKIKSKDKGEMLYLATLVKNL
ncbi:MAG: GNAT family N-acetyltransferase [Candidatus Staskawiczbacteria bacterium]|nr:GNAT family N-acetyltransferase [Candidatus Staskawiczbacteria bacterium]